MGAACHCNLCSGVCKYPRGLAKKTKALSYCLWSSSRSLLQNNFVKACGGAENFDLYLGLWATRRFIVGVAEGVAVVGVGPEALAPCLSSIGQEPRESAALWEAKSRGQSEAKPPPAEPMVEASRAAKMQRPSSGAQQLASPV